MFVGAVEQKCCGEIHQSSSGDYVHNSTNYLMSIGCMCMLFSDAIKEGDGSRVLLYYRYFLPLFINAGCRNYANTIPVSLPIQKSQ